MPLSTPIQIHQHKFGYPNFLVKYVSKCSGIIISTWNFSTCAQFLLKSSSWFLKKNGTISQNHITSLSFIYVLVTAEIDFSSVVGFFPKCISLACMIGTFVTVLEGLGHADFTSVQDLLLLFYMLRYSAMNTIALPHNYTLHFPCHTYANISMLPILTTI